MECPNAKSRVGMSMGGDGIRCIRSAVLMFRGMKVDVVMGFAIMSVGVGMGMGMDLDSQCLPQRPETQPD